MDRLICKRESVSSNDIYKLLFVVGKPSLTIIDVHCLVVVTRWKGPTLWTCSESCFILLFLLWEHVRHLELNLGSNPSCSFSLLTKEKRTLYFRRQGLMLYLAISSELWFANSPEATCLVSCSWRRHISISDYAPCPM